jgi:uncharacterized protein (TIGR02145 family)
MKTFTLKTIFITLSLITILGCSNDDSVSTPPPTAPDAPIIGTATAGDGQATVLFTASANNGGSPITSYTATSSPGNITGTLTQSGSGTITVTGLTTRTAYTFTVTATNAVGVSSPSTSSNSVTTTYPTVFIGTQYWMEKNLEVTHYRNGDMIPNVSDPTAWEGLTTGAWCYYNNDSESGYGKLYNWYAVNDPRGLAPTGWHVPSHAEWTTLSTYLGGTTVAGGAMKETGTTHWTSPNTDATNSSGFSGLPGGYRYVDGEFFQIGRRVFWWSSTEYNTEKAWLRFLDSSDGKVIVSLTPKLSGFSVRCLRD